MVRPAKIYHTKVILQEDKVEALINGLHELGLCELKESNIDLESKYSYELVKNLDEISNRFDFVTSSLEEYKEIVQPGSRLKKLFNPKAPKKHKSILYSTEEIIEEVKHHLSLIEPKITERLNKLENLRAQIQKNEFVISNLSLLPNIKTELFRSSQDIKVFSGLVTDSSLEKIKNLDRKAVIAVEQKEKNLSFAAVFASFEESADVEKHLHSIGFQPLEIFFENKKPAEIISELKKEASELKEEIIKIELFFKKTQKLYEHKFAILSEELGIAKEKIKALHNFKTTKAFSILEAWVPEKSFEKFHKLVKESSKNYYIEIDEKADAPTLLQNHKLVTPFEMLTELYSPPKYKGFDPTFIIAISFPIFFGIMLTDTAYGIILGLLGVILYRGIGKIDEVMKKFAAIIIILGISTTIMGIIFGSYFGDFFQKMGINLPIPIDAMKQVMLTLSIVLVVGYLHLITGLVSGFYENMHNGSFKDAMSKQGVWLIFMASLFLFLIKLNTAGFVTLIAAVAFQMLFNFLDGGAISSLLSVFGFSGFIGDLFSYARLMALAISTSGIALAVNFMVFMAVDMIPYAGWIIGILIFAVGHLFNIVMNSLGASIHSTRLHFLEFFTKFYDGGGKSYKPFAAERKNTFI